MVSSILIKWMDKAIASLRQKDLSNGTIVRYSKQITGIQ